MSRPDSRFISTEYAPDSPCNGETVRQCKANAYEWRFCDRHERSERDAHVAILADHAARHTEWLK